MSVCFRLHDITLVKYRGCGNQKRTVLSHSPHIKYIIHISVHDYIMPIPAPPAGIAGVSSLIVATTDSVVKSVDATLVAF